MLRHDWNINPRDVVALLSEKPRDDAGKILASMISGPIDIDKMDYLYRDSLHAGVPYGRHFDQQRLLGSLCLNQAGNGLAITDKAKTAAELMVFARYVMFSEVYWHHGVRAATAMLQRAFYLLHGALDLDAIFRSTEQEMIAELLHAGSGGPAGELLAGTFRPHAAALQAIGAVQLFRAARALSAIGPAAVSLAGGLRRAFRGRRQFGAWAASSPRTKFCSMPRRSRAKWSSTSRSSSPSKASIARWAKSRRSSTRWPRSSSTITSSASASSPIPASSKICGN